MTKKTGWNYIIGLAWLSTISLLWANSARLIPNEIVALSISIVMIIIAAGASIIGLYRLKKKKY
ncbi:hypothetical protein H9I32_21415 [Bacillus sp. Xin]|uniref:hypothetical protein n=1 Tax=unclassified Bacillus (in: firmicutes) TaxID=185979 RepID=UPI00157188E2|nr:MULTISPECIES: hypothetical protein [unclassified Bacillus (in: firmicutes)]MBC6974855.1 hypothetical protein [Bacillus sp. Xin]NSW39546.1 hypothetical protein [Bacillus sp. Xin1]